jgi:hypothetical protein
MGDEITYTGVSAIKLNDIPLDIDPENYQLFDGRRRGSVHRLVDGGSVFQDRGFDPTDMVISIRGKLTSQVTLQALCALYRLTASEFSLKDFKGNEFQVVFTPGDKSFSVSPIYGSNKGYEYTMSLSVVSVTKWFDEAGGFPSSV